VFNLSGSEIVIIMLLALVILGPEKLPDAMRKAGKAWGELRKLSSGFQDEVRKGFDEPTREVRQTAAAVRKAATFDLSPTKGAVKSLLAPSEAATVSKPAPDRDVAPDGPDAPDVPDAPDAPDAAVEERTQEPAADQPAPDHPTTESNQAAEADTTP